MANFILGATIETNRDQNYENYSKAPLPSHRAFDLIQFRKHHPYARIFISIEPIMRFDLDALYKIVHKVHPETVYIGYDSQHSALPEPTAIEAWELVDYLRNYLINVDVRLKKMPARPRNVT
jgi:hypothetical protein